MRYSPVTLFCFSVFLADILSR